MRVVHSRNDAYPHINAVNKQRMKVGRHIRESVCWRLVLIVETSNTSAYQEPCNGRCSWVCNMCLFHLLKDVISFVYIQRGVFVARFDRRVSSKTSTVERATVRFHAFRTYLFRYVSFNTNVWREPMTINTVKICWDLPIL